MHMRTYILALVAMLGLATSAQEQAKSSATMTRGSRTRHGAQTETEGPGVSQRMKNHTAATATDGRTDASQKYMKVVYRELDLVEEKANAPLFYPEDLVEGNENLFRIMFRLLASNKVPAYQVLDGREEFTDERRVSMKDIVERYELTATQAKGWSEKNPVYEFNPVDVPTGQVLVYYVIERWQFDNVSNRMKTTVEAICPVIVRDDAYEVSGRSPMFWMKMSDLKPYLQRQYIFVDDDNNLASYTYDDFFTLNMYKGDIYKTRNLRNLTLDQMVNEDDAKLKKAQDSIQNRLEHYADNLWVPSREELAAKHEAELAAADTTAVAEEPKNARSTRSRSARTARAKKENKPKVKVKREKPKATKPSASSSATRSVRNRRK